jgi:hypothetical protein
MPSACMGFDDAIPELIFGIEENALKCYIGGEWKCEGALAGAFRIDEGIVPEREDCCEVDVKQSVSARLPLRIGQKQNGRANAQPFSFTSIIDASFLITPIHHRPP